MAEIKTAAQLREELAAAEWKEYLSARRARQSERIELLFSKVAAKTRELKDAQKKLAEIDVEIAGGVIGLVPKPGLGGVSVTPLPANLGVRGN